MKTTGKISWQSSLIITGILILCVALASFFASEQINCMEEERGFQRLYEETNSLAGAIETEMRNDREQLELIAAILAEYETLDIPEVRHLLDSYDGGDMISRLELLLPDNTVLTGKERVNAGGILSFEKEAEQSAHISDREMDLGEAEHYIVRHYVPVIKDGAAVAMLYGVIELGKLPEDLEAEPYGGKAAIYIIEGNTGDFLVDTWHNDGGGNIWELGERRMAPGYDHEQLKQGLTDGETGYVVFVSETIGEHLYFYFEPLGINEWRIALSVPEDVVFESANLIRNVLNVFLAFEAGCFVLYFLWMFRYVKKETGKKQRQLDMVNYIYDVEKLLFNAHEKQENVTEALKNIAYMILARGVVFWFWETPTVFNSFRWQDDRQSIEWNPQKEEENVRFLKEYFEQGNTQFEVYGLETLKKSLPNSFSESVKNLTAIPVKNMDGSVCGILACCGMEDRRAALPLLKSVEFSFSMFCHNLRSYYLMKEQGEKDVLLGLYNRNRYEQDIKGFDKQQKDSAACVYIDVNGLHELNNMQGHEAGDRMLKKVAGQILETFGEEYAYRIGGDEFVVFVMGAEEEAVARRGRIFEEALEKENVHVSVGIQWERKLSSVDELIKAAEKKMYDKKKIYYEQEAHDRRRRERK